MTLAPKVYWSLPVTFDRKVTFCIINLIADVLIPLWLFYGYISPVLLQSTEPILIRYRISSLLTYFIELWPRINRPAWYIFDETKLKTLWLVFKLLLCQFSPLLVKTCGIYVGTQYDPPPPLWATESWKLLTLFRFKSLLIFYVSN